jgi:predicted Zn-dependent protease
MSSDQRLKDTFRVATTLRDAGDLAGARELLERLAAEHPSAFAVWLVLGGVQMSQEDYAAAEKSFSVAIKLRPTSELASLSMFHTLKHLGHSDFAFAEMRRFLALRPESDEYRRLRDEFEDGESPL